MFSLAYEYKTKMRIILSYKKTAMCKTKQIKSNIKDKLNWMTGYTIWTFHLTSQNILCSFSWFH